MAARLLQHNRPQRAPLRVLTHSTKGDRISPQYKQSYPQKRDNAERTITTSAMLQTFRAVLTGNSIEWIDEVPQLGDQSIPIHITVLEENLGSDSATRGQRMAEVLEKLVSNGTFSNIDPVAWQREVRHDRSILGRDE